MAVSPARYPNPTRKRKPSTAKGTSPAGKKKKENHEGTCLSEIPHDETVEVLQEGVSYPQPSEEETKEAVQELMNELSVMMDQATPTPPPPPPSTREDDIKPFTTMVTFANMFRAPAEDYMVCPHHQVRLEERVSQKMGWEYVKCPMHPCLLFCAKEKALDNMREVYRQPHADVRNMWSCLLCCLLCFCRQRFHRATPKTTPDDCF